MLWLKSKKVVLDFFTEYQSVADGFPIKPAAHYVPSWWKRLPTSFDEVSNNLNRGVPKSTMKSCDGFRELYARGLIMPMWSELLIDVYDKWYAYEFSDRVSSATFHNIKQYGDAFPQFMSMKIIPPWFVKSKHDIKFLFAPCIWSLLPDQTNIVIPHGVTSYKSTHSTNINMMIKKAETSYTVNIKAGTPLIQFIPLSDIKVVPKIHVVDSNEYNKIKNTYVAHSFANAYRTFIKHKWNN